MYRSVLHLLVAALPAAVSAAPKQNCCQLVGSKIPGRISYPGSTTYNSSIASYYGDSERELSPNCIYRPTTTSEVQQFVQLVTSGSCTNNQFAIRGGGHTFWTGAANIQPGITVDMRVMKSLQLSTDQKIAGIGGGALWDDIYPQLVPYNLTVMGGRIPGIGVGGFATGGGITFASREHGFSCDNIVGYEIVLGNGKVAYASAASNPDLWLALKGGSNNFGIITRFDIATIPQGKMSYNLVSYDYTNVSLQAQANAFSNFMKPANFDKSAMMGMFLNYLGGQMTLSNALWYIQPVQKPTVYNPFFNISSANVSVSQLDTIDKVVEKFGEDIPTHVERGYQLTFSFRNPDAATYLQLFKIWETAMPQLAHVAGIYVEFLIQPHPVTNGTNLFGLQPGKTDDVMVDMTSAFTNKADDALVTKVLTNIVEQQKRVLKKSGYLIDFLYLNYADISQPVLQSWGKSSVEKLKVASREFDPTGVFQKQVPGGFKIPK
ncbi:MAG: hypothetical protein L6R37_004149 [Teloschistes peruensis]|nr:MAG: hypothetical protein L6R37_004149 [Teloschistes peruensis]